VLAGHSGVGKSSLIRALQPHLELRITQVSRLTGKGKHATTVARRYPLDFGGQVIDTPGVKLFGLWGVTKENLLDYFPDVADDVAPKWREESCGRILQGLREARGF
jgi:ribosome biogenesis GTPase